jgi:hypothetical protein
MGHEAIIYGRIEGAHWEFGERFSWTYELNQVAIASIPLADKWPWLVQGMFALPSPWPMGTYRSQIIHFGASIKDAPGEEEVWDSFTAKFEAVLRTLYWWSAVLHLETDFIPHRIYKWVPTRVACSRILDDPPHPVTDWERTIEPPILL